MQRLWLLGPARVEQIPESQKTTAKSAGDECQTRAVPRFRSRRTVALLGYLVAERRTVARDFLAALFWPDEATSKGRSNLRRELHNLTQILPGCWELGRQAVAFVPSADVEVDIYTLQQLEAQAHWQEAADLLLGEFLEGLYLDDNSEFENWLLGERERWRGSAEAVLTRVIQGLMRRGQYSAALRHTRRLLQLAPWNEGAHRQAMRLLAWTGQRGAALRQFETCRQALREELGIEPAGETTTLFEQIQAGALDLPPQLPAFLTDEGARHRVDHALFVAREQQLAQLDTFLDRALAGQSQICFVTGGPGRGKTALMDAFARRTMEVHPNLLVANGNCNAYSDVGDPYLPFRDVMAMLSGDVEAKWDAGTISRDHAQRLWAALPLVVQALLDHGPHLLNVLVPAAALLSRAMLAEPADAPWLAPLRAQVSRPEAMSLDVEQSDLFQQVTNVLRNVAREQPLLLILDDLQWADLASASLLFHLGRRLAGADSRVLIVCAYRPEEVALERAGPAAGPGQAQRHPLARALSEFKRLFGDVWVDLGQADRTEGRRFIDALLDVWPNRLAEGFRATLFHRTQGHPLFTVELLRAMQQRGDLVADREAYWIEGPELDWETLPARVEAVIAERIGRLSTDLQDILNIASVEGEVFTAQVVAAVRQVAERPLLYRLSHELEGRHRLVREQEEMQTTRRRLARYRFEHVLFRDYVYNRLSPGERRLLHGEVAAALERCYHGQLDEIAVRLAHHCHQAGDDSHALPWFIQAAENASRVYANVEAYAHYTRAIEAAERIAAEAASVIGLYIGRGLVAQRLGDFEGALDDYESALQLARSAGQGNLEHLQWRALVEMGRLWTSRDYGRAHHCFQDALELAQQMGAPALLASSLNWMGNWHANAEAPVTAATYHQTAMEIVEELEDRRELVNTLDLLGLAHLLGGDLTASVRTYDRAIALCQELDDRPRLVTSLIARAISVTELVMLASLPALAPPDALRDLEEAIRIAREIHSASDEAWAHWALGLLHAVQGRYGKALEVSQRGLEIASRIGHREWIVGNRCALGCLSLELLAPERALCQLKGALTLAGELRSQVWIHRITGALAEAHSLYGDLKGAQTCLERVLSPQTPMDTMGNRYCWARRAQLALAQGNPELALDIAQRLITSAPGMSPGRVITFLWTLKAEAVAATGHTEEAQALLQAAIENAQATGERFLLWPLHASLGHLYQALGRQPEAEKALSTAHRLVDELANSVPDRGLRDNFVQRAQVRLGTSP
jgi:adenylate cyclase